MRKAITGRLALPAAALLAAHCTAAHAQQGFWEDASANLQLKNYYYNRDFRDGVGQGKREEWAQGAILDLRSGYTPGRIGFGLDLLGLLDIKLDAKRNELGTGILPIDANGARDILGRIGPTAKLRLSDTELRVGTLIPRQPLVKASVSRMLPQTFTGAWLQSGDLENLDLFAARLTRSYYRDGTGNQRMTLTNKNGRFSGTPDTDAFSLAGGEYAATPGVKLRYQVGRLDDIYLQQFGGVTVGKELGPGKLALDLGLFDTRNDGARLAGAIDNRTLNAGLGYSLAGQSLTLSYQGVSGRTAMPWLGGTDGNVAHWSYVNDFLEREERSWQLRYTVSGEAIGLPGLSASVKYVRADHARPANIIGEGREWERDSEIVYRFRNGFLKHFSATWINATYRSNFARGADENRLILQYEAKLR